MSFYPLALNNEWHYKMKDGSRYINKVTGANGNDFTMHNSSANTSSVVRTDGNHFATDALEAGNFQQWLKNDLQKDESWEIRFKANGLDCLLIMTVKETGMSKVVEGTTYNNVMFLEAENKVLMNGTIMPLNFFTQYYYAAGTGLVLTTSSAGDIHALVNAKLH